MKRIPPMVTLRALREAHGLTLEQLAERIAEQGVTVDKASLANIELGKRTASRRLIAAHARALRLESVDVYQAADLRALVYDEPERKTA
ncbi:helix-turn-helix transcriptional regulator [Actinomadura miaoliensis]|uniref:HTH cro/C1-type domain-containing protein n=1 Tax=Actinomadura miaoliensis TaxID=430685 RepID=A0ABP7V5H5_9ACTN